jgi:hypothetical protein
MIKLELIQSIRLFIISIFSLIILSSCGGGGGVSPTGSSVMSTSAKDATAVSQSSYYQQTNLVSNIPGLAVTTDTNLVNSWGIVHPPTGPWWVNDNGTGVSTGGFKFEVQQLVVAWCSTFPPRTTPHAAI